MELAVIWDVSEKGFSHWWRSNKKLTPASKICDRSGPIIWRSPLGVMLTLMPARQNFEALLKNSDAAQPMWKPSNTSDLNAATDFSETMRARKIKHFSFLKTFLFVNSNWVTGVSRQKPMLFFSQQKVQIWLISRVRIDPWRHYAAARLTSRLSAHACERERCLRVAVPGTGVFTPFPSWVQFSGLVQLAPRMG